MSDKDRMKPSDREHIEKLLLSEVRTYLDELEKGSPSWDDGERFSLTFRGARAGYTSDDHPLFSFQIKRTQEQML